MPLAPDTPPDVAIALEVVKTLTSAGRCREDAELYAAATALLRAYLATALPAEVQAHAPPRIVPIVPTGR